MSNAAATILRSWNSSEAKPEDSAPPEPIAEVRELTFGLYLRRERMLRGISRSEVIRVTKVKPHYLEALEANQFDRLPPRAFVVGFLRVLSSYAGLNGDEVVNRFLTALAQKEAFEENRHPKAAFWNRYGKILLGALGLAGLIALMFAPLLRN